MTAVLLLYTEFETENKFIHLSIYRNFFCNFHTITSSIYRPKAVLSSLGMKYVTLLSCFVSDIILNKLPERLL